MLDDIPLKLRVISRINSNNLAQILTLEKEQSHFKISATPVSGVELSQPFCLSLGCFFK